MKRRTFFKVAGITTFFAASGLLWSLGGDEKKVVTAAVRARLPWLKINQASLEKFAADFVNHYPKNPLRVTSASILRSFTNLFTSEKISKERLNEHEDIIIERFIRGSDFLMNGADETQEVTYLHWPEQRDFPCSEVFSYDGE